MRFSRVQIDNEPDVVAKEIFKRWLRDGEYWFPYKGYWDYDDDM